MKTILLGLFHTNAFTYQVQQNGYDTYPFEKVNGDMWVDCNGIIDIVSLACSRAEHIVFVLDELLPKSIQSGITTEELDFILNNPRIMDKTTFIKAQINVEHSEVTKIYGLQEIAQVNVDSKVVNRPTWLGSIIKGFRKRG